MGPSVRNRLWPILILTVPPALLAQQPKQSAVERVMTQLGDAQKAKAVPKSTATAIGAHRLGETLEGWLAAEKFTYRDDACEAQKQKEKGWWSDFDRRDAVMNLPASGEQEAKRVGEECERQMSSIARGDGELTVGGDFKDRNGRKFIWEFANHKLTKVSITIPSNGLSQLEADTLQEMAFLTEAFGAPTQAKMSSYQNAYGAKWDCPEATWLMQDGTTIFAWESIRNTDAGPRRGFNIVFSQKIESSPPRPNPYRP